MSMNLLLIYYTDLVPFHITPDGTGRALLWRAPCAAIQRPPTTNL